VTACAYICWAADTNKALLVQSARLIPLLLDGCFWGEDHPRKDADDHEKAPVQNDAIECLLQIAVFKPGRELLQSDPTVMDALAAMAAGKAITEEGKLSAHNALVAIEGVMREPEPDTEGALISDKHIMVSYQWVRCSSQHQSKPASRALLARSVLNSMRSHSRRMCK
jgi:hypothetical protein